MGVFYFFDARDIYLIRQHIPRKYFYSYFISGFIFVFNLIVIFVYIALIHQIEQAIDKDVQLKTNIIFGILFGIAAIVSLVTIGMYRYAKFRIDLTLYRRRHGENDTRQDQTSSGVSSDQATSGLTTDNVSKK
jgi:hypothetical protein